MGETDHREPILRRWVDRILMASAASIVALIGLIYGGLSRQIANADESGRSMGERVKAVEVRQEDTHQRLEKIEGKLDRVMEHFSIQKK